MSPFDDDSGGEKVVTLAATRGCIGEVPLFEDEANAGKIATPAITKGFFGIASHLMRLEVKESTP